jgi:hypothetical protein
VSRDLFLIFGKTGGDDRNAEIRHGDGTIASIGDEKVDLRHDLCLGQDEAMRALEIAYAPFVSRLESRTAIRSREYLTYHGPLSFPFIKLFAGRRHYVSHASCISSAVLDFSRATEGL